MTAIIKRREKNRKFPSIFHENPNNHQQFNEQKFQHFSRGSRIALISKNKHDTFNWL